MSYKFIINPIDDKLYSIHSELGRNLIKQYIQQVGAGEDAPKPEETSQPVVEDKPKEPEETSQPVVEDKPKEPEETTQPVVEDKPKEIPKEPVLENDDIQTDEAEVNKVLAMWIGGLWEKIKSLFSKNNTDNPVQEGGNDSEYVKKVLNFIV